MPIFGPCLACTSLSDSITPKLVINPGTGVWRRGPGARKPANIPKWISQRKCSQIHVCVLVCEPWMYVVITDRQEHMDGSLFDTHFWTSGSSLRKYDCVCVCVFFYTDNSSEAILEAL